MFCVIDIVFFFAVDLVHSYAYIFCCIQYFEGLAFGPKVYGPNAKKAGQKVLIYRMDNYDVADMIEKKPNKAAYSGHPDWDSSAYAWNERWGARRKQYVAFNLNVPKGQPSIEQFELRVKSVVSSPLKVDDVLAE